MKAFLIRRMLQTLITLFVVSLISFTLSMVLPGDPSLSIVGSEGASEAMVQNLRQELGLDRPIVVQYFKWLGALVSGDFGVSIRTRAHVLTLFGQRLPVTLELLGFGILFALLIAIPMGIFSALRPNTWVDTAGTVIAVSGVAMPQFFLGMILILVFSIWLGWLPSSGYVSPADNLVGNLKGMILPAISLGSVVAAEIMRQLRSSMLEVLGEEFVQTARAKGVPEFQVIIRHVLRNALIPVVTLLGMRIGRLIGGIVIIEVVFSLPGIGRLLMNAVLFNDFPVLQTGVLLVALAVTLLNLLADVSYSFLDPRIRHT
ncbi:MAG: ABC transporter permease [Deltaproteobacteria bacterium]|nr:ABC transporter permease [Deltaproteobacteria bacterium]